MDGNREGPWRNPLFSELVLKPHLNYESPLPASCQTISHPGNESGITSTQQDSGYSLLNARPPVDMNDNGACGENRENKADEKYIDPPSYEEAMKFMPYLSPEELNTNYLRSHHIDYGQFAFSEPHFSPRQYEEPGADTDLPKSICSNIVKLILIIGLVSLLLRLVFLRL